MGKFAELLANLAQGIEPEVDVSYEETQLFGRAAATAPPSGVLGTIKTLLETAQSLESKGNPSGALELYRRAETLASADNVLRRQIQQSIQRLEGIPPPVEPIYRSAASSTAAAKPKPWRWVWAVAGVSAVGFIVLAILAVIGISSLLKTQEKTPIAAERPTPTGNPESTATITPLPTMPPTPAVEATPIEISSPTLQPLPTLTMPLQSLVNQNCGEGDIIRSIEAVDTLTVKFTLCQRDPGFLQKIALPFLGIQPADFIIQTRGRGDFFDQPIGTGPYEMLAWVRGEYIALQQFPGYNGQPARESIINIRYQNDDAVRLTLIQSGEADLAPSVSSKMIGDFTNDPNLMVITYPSSIITYIGINNQYAPFNDIRFRKALAMGIDRSRIVQESFPAGAAVSLYLNSCAIPSACEGEPWYDFDPEAAKTLLEEAGYSQGIKIKIYVRDVSRSHLPNPKDTVAVLQQELNTNLGIQTEVFYLDSGQFFTQLSDGELDGLYLLGWTSDYLHPYNLLHELFTSSTPYVGDPYPDIISLLQTAKDDPFNTVIYAQINDQIRADIPLIPLANSSQYHAASRSLSDVTLTPFGSFYLNQMSSGKGEINLLIPSEPYHVYCGVEYNISFCSQVVESLMGYDSEGNVVLVLAERWESSDFGLEWTFHLKPGVLFHNGKTLDANDVVMTFTALIDAGSPYHDQSGDVYYEAEYLFGLVND